MVAFASKTEALIKKILDNGNQLSLMVGTINHFTDPVFIRDCQKFSKQKPSKFDDPFILTSELKGAIKSKCGSWLKANKTYLNWSDLRELGKLLKTK